MLSDPDADEPEPFDDAFRVTPADPEVFEIHAESFKHNVSFKLTLLYDSEWDGRVSNQRRQAVHRHGARPEPGEGLPGCL